jgi:transcription initiation factor TFIID subunit 2
MSLWVKKTFGVNEYRDLVHRHMYEIVEYESKYGGIILDSSQAPANIVSIKGEASR